MHPQIPNTRLANIARPATDWMRLRYNDLKMLSNNHGYGKMDGKDFFSDLYKRKKVIGGGVTKKDADMCQKFQIPSLGLRKGSSNCLISNVNGHNLAMSRRQ